MSENINLSKNTEGTKFFITCIWIIMLILFMSAPLIFFLYPKEKSKSVDRNLASEFEILKRELNSVREKNLILTRDIAALSDRIDIISSDGAFFEKRLVSLENQTLAGQDKNVKIMINLNRVQKLIKEGESFSENLHFLEKISSKNGEQRELIGKMQNYEGINLSDNKIMKTFDREIVKITVAQFSDKKFRRFIDSNVRIVKINEKNGDIDKISNFSEMARKYISYHDYRGFRALVEENDYRKIFEETLALVGQREELERLINSLFRTIYRPD